ncbi:MAG TPA: hypothetical protein VFO30_04725 [Chthoniobacterales bacterium]|nr:hypothetical protein [Chthoniobacterales bacterium]
MRDQWHQSDLYQLYREPAVQDFLRKPLDTAPKADAARQAFKDIEQLDPKDAFAALTSIENNKPRLLAGFRFRGRQAAVEQIIGKWRANLLHRNRNATREKTTHGRHEIEAVSAGGMTLATTYAQQWFFAANDVSELEALLDRADAVKQDRQSALQSDEAYRGAVGHMPSEYALLVYLQPKAFAEKLDALRATFGQQISADKPTLIEQIRNICGAIRFERGKMHDVFFAAMPRQTDAKLTRSTEALGTADTFFYLATLLNPQNLGATNQAAAIAPLGGWLQKFIGVTQKSGITANDWKAAFDLELSALADWPPNARWPSFIATLPVRDSPRAQKIVAAMTAALDEDAAWIKTEKEGVTYFTIEASRAVFAISPTLGLSDRLFVAGLDPSAVTAAIERSQKSNAPLSNSPTYKTAARILPEPTESFAYVDVALLYSRLDAAVRPLLMLGAAFLPAIANDVDLAKLPPQHVITKHLSPIVSSQRYERDGYIAESIGPVTANEAVLVIGLAVVYRGFAGHHAD